MNDEDKLIESHDLPIAEEAPDVYVDEEEIEADLEAMELEDIDGGLEVAPDLDTDYGDDN